MLLVLVLPLLVGLVLTAEPPQPTVAARRPTAVALRSGAPVPAESPRAPRDRLRACREKQAEGSSHLRPEAGHETVYPPPVRHRPCRGSPLTSGPSPEPLIYALCALLI
jgi:hypothetical protein